MQRRQVWELVNYQQPLTVRGTATLRETALQMLVSGADVMAVTDDDGRLQGVITECSIVRALLLNPQPAVTIEHLIHRHVESIRENTEIPLVLPMFRLSCHSAVPVVDVNQRVCGMLRRTDVMAELLKDADEQPAKAVDISRQSRIDSGTVTETPLAQRSAEQNITTTDRNAPVTIIQKSSAHMPNDGMEQRPHFLSGDSARKVLRAADDWRMGSFEQPW